MIFIGGFGQGQKDLGFLQTLICKNCGRYGSVSVFMVYSYFSFFFIPLFRWGKTYYALSSCCNTTFPISKELGKAIERGENVILNQEDLQHTGHGITTPAYCPDCGFTLSQEYTYCPQCARKIKE